MINAYIEQAIQSIEAEREQQIATLRDTVIREKVAPKNAEIDLARDKAIQEMQTKLNADIAMLQETFAKQRQEIIDASEKQKSDNANVLVGAETVNIAVEYDTILTGLRKLIGA